jgi:hypothetical protein
MPINASDIASLGLTGGNPVQSMEQGYKLADLVDQRAINKMKIQGVQQEMQDVQTIKNVLSKHDVSTPEGQAKAAAEAIKISPEYGLKLQKAFTDQQTGQNENLKSELEIVAKKNDVLSAAAVPVYMQIQKMRADGRTDAEIDAAVMPAVTQVITTLKNQTLPNGKPILSPEEMQGVASGLQRGGLANAMDTWMMNSEKTKGLIESRLKAESKFGPTKTMTGDQGPGVYERNERTGKWTKVGGMAPTAAAQNQAAGVTAAGGLDDETATALAGQLAEGVPPRDVIAGLSAKDRAKVQNQYTKVMQEQGLSPAMMVAKRIQLRATQKAVDSAAAQGGKVSTGLIELQEFAPLARQASAKVNREKFKPYNELVQIGERNLNDEDLARLYAMTTSVLNAYDVVASRGGTDVDKRKHAREMLSTAMDQKTYNVALDTIVQESEAAERAAQKAMQPGVYNPTFQAPATPSANAAPAGGAQNYQEGQTATNAKGDRMIFRGGQWQPMQ